MVNQESDSAQIIWKVLHIPDWLPGSWIKREAREAYAWRTKLIETPYQYVQERMVSFDWSRKKRGRDQVVLFQESKVNMNASMVSDHITRMENFDSLSRSQYETAVKHVAVTAFLGKSTLTRTNQGRISPIIHVYAASGETVRTETLVDGCIAHGTHRQPQY